MTVSKLTIEFCQEADNAVGHEVLEITVNPVLIDLWKDGKVDHYYELKTDGFLFEDKAEAIKLFEQVEKIVNATKE